MMLNQSLKTYLTGLPAAFDDIPEKRKADLEKVSQYIQDKRNANDPIKLTVICTHNSRRSHMGQLWLLAAAYYYHIDAIFTFSGGTEATAFHPNAVEALRRAGFHIKKVHQEANSLYEVHLGQDLPAVSCFSKLFDHESNPSDGFAAIMVCDEANEACPFIPGAEQRFAISFEDPKAYDGTPQEQEQYDLRCRQIAKEFLYIFSRLN